MRPSPVWPQAPTPGPAITVIGGGLAGSVLALCLARRGACVRLIGAGRDTATGLSYGAMMRGGPSRAWRRLESHHGPLGWRPSGLVVHDQAGGIAGALASLTRTLPLPLARVDSPTWMDARRAALANAGVQTLAGHVQTLQASRDGPWRMAVNLEGVGAQELEAATVVLATGAGSRALWPALAPQLRHSWAGVLLLDDRSTAPEVIALEAESQSWLDQAWRGRIVQPRHWRRPALEASAANLAQPAWIVDAGLAPWGGGLVVGQISLIRPASSSSVSGQPLEPPDPIWMEARLREGLAALDPALAHLQATYRQVPVSFCVDGVPLVGPVPEAPGLWQFAGFSAAFSRVPAEAEALAEQLIAACAAQG